MIPLTTEKQIEVIDKAVELYIENHGYNYSGFNGLCICIIACASDDIKESVQYKPQDFIPLFTRENALQFGASLTGYHWWNINDIDSRVKFSEWIKSELKKL